MSTEHYLIGKHMSTEPSVSVVEHSCKFDVMVTEAGGRT